MIQFCNIGCCINHDKVNNGANFTLERYLERIPAYKEAGITHLELSHMMGMSVEDAAVLRDACRKMGLVIWSIHSENFNDCGGMSPGGAYDGTSLETFFANQLHCAKAAQAAGASAFVCHLPNYTKEPRFDFERNLKFMERLGDLTHQYGLTLALENCVNGDLDHIIQIVDKLNRPDIGINLDVGHCFYFQNHDVASEVRKIGKRLVTLHLHDNFGQNDDHQAPGMGLIDWQSVIAAIQETPYEGPLMMELTCMSVKSKRTVELLREFPYEKELCIGAACLRYYFEKVKALRCIKRT